MGWGGLVTHTSPSASERAVILKRLLTTPPLTGRSSSDCVVRSERLATTCRMRIWPRWQSNMDVFG